MFLMSICVSRCDLCCLFFVFVFFFKQKTAYEMRISDWSSDVCSSDLDSDFARKFYESKTAPTRRALRELFESWQKAGIGLKGSPETLAGTFQIGRALCRERVCPYV